MKATLSEVLTLDQLEADCFRATHHKENFQRTLFGGQVLAQAIIAAGRTSELPPHSFHAYFLRAGNGDSPVDYRVTRNRDGRSFSHRSVEAWQDNKMIFSAMASFHQQEERGFRHADSWGEKPQDPTATLAQTPVELAPDQPTFKADAFEFYPISGGMLSPDVAGDSHSRFWMRCTEVVAEDPLTQVGAMAYASDFGLLATSLSGHPTTLFQGGVMAASVDHALWFHAENLNMADWVLYDVESPWAGGARGFSRGKMFAQDGTMLSSVAQEGLIRPLA